ncbi:secretoglobin family 3A member 2 isoform X2 [Alexandromys fortis]|uniref:secretoglobin family 3A member 2 isoform X2 n=1 Tax=Alexandromys fortis TaxID=100897 RepID=UPI0021520919|nr:secretoglobin family 3A member 2 isoform X2 [Microtus fortis]
MTTIRRTVSIDADETCWNEDVRKADQGTPAIVLSLHPLTPQHQCWGFDLRYRTYEPRPSSSTVSLYLFPSTTLFPYLTL